MVTALLDAWLNVGSALAEAFGWPLVFCSFFCFFICTTITPGVQFTSPDLTVGRHQMPPIFSRALIRP